MTTGRDDQQPENPTADSPWRDVADRTRDWLVGYDRGREDALAGASPDGATAFVHGLSAGMALAQDSARQEHRGRAGWEEAIDQLLDEAQRLLRDGQILDAHRAISGVRRSLDAPQDARIARMGLR